MTRFAPVILLALLVSAVPSAHAATQPAASTLTIPAGSTVDLVNTRVVWMKSANPGDTLYLQVTDPLLIGDLAAIPAGTYVQATLTALTLPTKDDDQAVLHLRFEKIIFPNGYIVSLADSAQHAPLTRVTVVVSMKNDVLLDNGMWLHMLLPDPLALDPQQIAQAAQLARAPGPFSPGTLCHSTPVSQSSPGMPDMNIPGNSSTPDQTIVSSNGGSTTVMPGRAGTPDMYIPGHPGDYSSGKPIVCPEPPSIRSSVPETSSQIASAATQANPALQQQALPTLTVPTGLSVPLTLSQMITHKSLKIGKPVSATVAFPVTVDNQLALPAGTVADGTIALKSETKKTHQPIATIHFTHLTYPNGYAVTLDTPATAEITAPITPSLIGDVVLFNAGWQLQMTTQGTFIVETAKVSGAASTAK
jgi:hypothetical protein